MQNIDQVLCEVCSYHAVWHIAYANGCLGWGERMWAKLSLVGIVFESFQEIETTRGCELYAGIDVIPPRKHTHTHKLQRASGDTILTSLLISSSLFDQFGTYGTQERPMPKAAAYEPGGV